jgi:hypothetical protein
VTSNKNPAPLAGGTGFGQQHQHGHYIPNETAARFHHALAGAQLEAANGGYHEALNYAEALANAASCHSCALRDPHTSECKAYPPRALMRDGKPAPVWPIVESSSWCASWRAL